MALDNGSGLIVPVVQNADEKNVTGLQRSIVDLAARARSRQLKPDEVKGGTFAITGAIERMHRLLTQREGRPPLLLMTGGAEFEFEGRFDPSLFARVGA